MPTAPDLIAKLLSGPCVLLEDRLTPAADAQLFHDPVAIIRCVRPEEVEGAFAQIEHALKDGLHAAGLLSYELGYVLEPKLAARLPAERDTPLLWFGLFAPPQRIAAALLDEALARLGPPAPLEDVQYGHDLAAHTGKLRDILAFIQAGDIYQANLTFPISFRLQDKPLRLYAALRTRQPVSFGGFAALGDSFVLSVSPELFVDVRG